MEVKKCLNCGKEVEQKVGRRERLYCNQSCKGLYFRKSKPKEKRYVQVDTYKRLVEENIELKRKLFEVKVTDATKPTNEVKPPEVPKTNYSINTERIAKIEDLLKLPPKYLPSEKRNKLEKELSELLKTA